ncbi:hypothetical protein ASG87_01500 [Frateuria sp. Soil773]|uniref:murein L,D-transpeptidase catalytic domain-containing protein n=1 Tax=Frateuria sp. Soil773 TaxID=1736407 RepID=UPI0006FED7B6|nr:murein L,D-transpeptidase catalytic domain family protein [Frateuria sp. Soil773]KRE90839.1 hypothetical protein ASG87_01500 [Frateuria sp. Soil773]
MFPILAQIHQAAPALPPAIAQRALDAATCAGRKARHLLIADMSQPSSHPRLWVLDLTNRNQPELIARTFVAHGAGSDPTSRGVAQKFSNIPDSNATSLGLYQVAESYVMAHHPKGYRLDGLTTGWDDQARTRGVVLHPASYVSLSGNVGRSNGCPALNPTVFNQLDKEGALAGSLLWIDGPGAPTISCPAAQSPWPVTVSPVWVAAAAPACSPREPS